MYVIGPPSTEPRPHRARWNLMLHRVIGIVLLQSQVDV